MVVNGGATFDLGGINQTIASLSDGAGGGGTVASNVASGYGSVTLTLAPAGGSATFSGVIQNGAGREQMNLTLSGSGTQVLAGSNTYSGLTTIAAGTLQIGSGGTTGSINNTSAVVDNGLLAFNRSDAVTFAVPVSGSGGLTQMADSLLTLTGNSTYSGLTTIAPAPCRSATAAPTARSAIPAAWRTTACWPSTPRPRRPSRRPSAATAACSK